MYTPFKCQRSIIAIACVIAFSKPAWAEIPSNFPENRTIICETRKGQNGEIDREVTHYLQAGQYVRYVELSNDEAKSQLIFRFHGHYNFENRVLRRTISKVTFETAFSDGRVLRYAAPEKFDEFAAFMLKDAPKEKLNDLTILDVTDEFMFARNSNDEALRCEHSSFQ